MSLGVSWTSLREAARALVLMNILRLQEDDGTYVSALKPELLVEPIQFLLDVNAESVFELLEVRRILEAGAAYLAAGRITDSELDELEECLEDPKGHGNDLKPFLKADVKFHGMICHASRSPLLTSLMVSVSLLALDSRSRTVKLRTPRSGSRVE